MNVFRGLVVAVVAVGLLATSFVTLDFGVREGSSTIETQFVTNAVNDSTARFEEGLFSRPAYDRHVTSQQTAVAVDGVLAAAGLPVSVPT